MNPLYSCSLEIEDISYYLLHCNHFSHYRIYLTNSVKSILENIESLPDSVKKDILLYFYILLRLDRNKNTFILEATLTYILRIYFWLKILLYWKLPTHSLINKWPTKLTSLTCIYFRSYVSPVNTKHCLRGSVVCFFVLL